MRQITAEQYRTQTGGDFDEVWLPLPGAARTEVMDVDVHQRLGMVILHTHGGVTPVMPDTLLNVE